MTAPRKARSARAGMARTTAKEKERDTARTGRAATGRAATRAKELAPEKERSRWEFAPADGGSGITIGHALYA